MSRNAGFARKSSKSTEEEQAEAEAPPSTQARPGRPITVRPPYRHSGVFRRSHGRRSAPPEESVAWSFLIAAVALGLLYYLARILNP